MPVIINEFTVDVLPPPPSETTAPAGGAPGAETPSYCQRLHEPAIAAERRERLTCD
jgi:hypothetical protein